MKVAVLGSGFMGKTHAEALKQIKNVELVGIYTTSHNPQSVTSFDSPIYTSFDKLMMEQKPDIVSVCLPTHLHKQYVLKAAELGVHIICEKPIALNLEDAREMISVCEEKKVKLFIGHVLRFFPEYHQLKTDVDTGKVGNIGVMHTQRANDHPGIHHKWYNDYKKSGGVILDLMIHDLDFMRYLNGEVKSVFAMNKRADNLDYALVTLLFENDAIANLEGLWGRPGSLEYSCEVYGDKGVLHLRNGKDPVKVSLHDKDIKTINPLYNDPYYLQLSHFITCLKDNEEPIVTTSDAYEAAKLSLAALKSINSGKPVLIKDVT